MERYPGRHSSKVALFASAWIETSEGTEIELVLTVALFASAWIETSAALAQPFDVLRRALRERVD